jgi:endoglucanase
VGALPSDQFDHADVDTSALPSPPVPGRRRFLALGSTLMAGFGMLPGGVGDRSLDILTADAAPLPARAAASAMPLSQHRRFAAVSAEDLAEWRQFRSRFISGDGRVVDTGNGGVSHSEGQGWGMMFAVAFNDQETFDRLLGWTSRVLACRTDTLHAWRYLPNASVTVPDTNNATDADLFIAAALSRAAGRWGRPDLAIAASGIARDILRLLVRPAGQRLVLLAGAQGFETRDQLTVNLSYYAWPMLSELAALVPSPIWAQLRQDGLALLDEGRFGAFRLPPDWLLVDRGSGALRPHPHWPARFSYDAIRVPLWLAWAGETPAASQDFAAYWAKGGGLPPAWIDLNTNAVASYPAPPGMVAVARIATASRVVDVKALPHNGFPPLRASPDYYSAALILLSRLAWQESCVA